MTKLKIKHPIKQKYNLVIKSTVQVISKVKVSIETSGEAKLLEMAINCAYMM